MVTFVPMLLLIEKKSIHAIVWLMVNTGESLNFPKFSFELFFQVRGSGGEHTETEGELRDFSNSRRLGKSELELVTEVFKGVNKLIEWEQNI